MPNNADLWREVERRITTLDEDLIEKHRKFGEYGGDEVLRAPMTIMGNGTGLQATLDHVSNARTILRAALMNATPYEPARLDRFWFNIYREKAGEKLKGVWFPLMDRLRAQERVCCEDRDWIMPEEEGLRVLIRHDYNWEACYKLRSDEEVGSYPQELRAARNRHGWELRVHRWAMKQPDVDNPIFGLHWYCPRCGDEADFWPFNFCTEPPIMNPSPKGGCVFLPAPACRSVADLPRIAAKPPSGPVERPLPIPADLPKV